MRGWAERQKPSQWAKGLPRPAGYSEAGLIHRRKGSSSHPERVSLISHRARYTHRVVLDLWDLRLSVGRSFESVKPQATYSEY